MPATHVMVDSPLGELTLTAEDGSLTGLYFPHHWYPPAPARHAVLSPAQHQIRAGHTVAGVQAPSAAGAHAYPPLAGHTYQMSVQLNHTIVSCRDQQRSAEFLAGILGLPPPTRFSHFLVVQADNGVSLDFSETSEDITAQHYAFLVGEEEFDASFGRIQDQGLRYWADPGRNQPGVINHRDDGRGLYFEDPDGHLLEILTRPYGSGG